MNAGRLVEMANDIDHFFKAEPNPEAAIAGSENQRLAAKTAAA